MDRIFEALETAAYEDWLASPGGLIYQQASCRLLERILDFRPGWRVLDVGCGLGVHLAHLRERGLMCQGLEAGPVMARLAAARLGSKVELDLGDAHDLPYEDNSFDAVVMVNTLEFLERPAQALAEAVRVAMSRLCLITLNPLSPSHAIWHWKAEGRHPLGQGRALPLWSLRRLVREVLGPVPQTWAGATLWPRVTVGPWPFGGLVGVCAAVTPRLMTRPLVVGERAQPRVVRPVASAGRISALERMK
jgi:SAM-dependent methyltransferase